MSCTIVDSQADSGTYLKRARTTLPAGTERRDANRRTVAPRNSWVWTNKAYVINVAPHKAASAMESLDAR